MNDNEVYMPPSYFLCMAIDFYCCWKLLHIIFTKAYKVGVGIYYNFLLNLKQIFVCVENNHTECPIPVNSVIDISLTSGICLILIILNKKMQSVSKCKIEKVFHSPINLFFPESSIFSVKVFISYIFFLLMIHVAAAEIFNVVLRIRRRFFFIVTFIS